LSRLTTRTQLVREQQRREPCWARTSDPLIKSQLLYRLS
jgi:hypothetical protein